MQDVLHVVNKGSMKDLLALHGIGKKRAEAIIDNRPFHRVPYVFCVARAWLLKEPIRLTEITTQLAELKKIGLGEKLFEAFMKRNVWEVV